MGRWSGWLTCLILIVCGAGASAQEPAGFRAGAATSVVTPPLGMTIIGNFAVDYSKHIHDELFARCIVLDDGRNQVALVVCDLLGVSAGVTHEAQRLIEKNSGIPAKNVLICGTHTHSASSALSDTPFSFDLPETQYAEFVARRIADGVQRAKNLLRPAEFACGTVEIPEHLFNRRWHLKPGKMPVNPFGNTDDKVKMNPAQGSPDLVEPAGPTDPSLSVLSFREPGGAPIALLASYSLHYVGGVPAGHISADYFGRFSEHFIQLSGTEQQNPPFVPILANGTSGDVNNINFIMPRAVVGPYSRMDTVAREVAEKVHAKLKELTYKRDVTLAATMHDYTIGVRRPGEALLKWADETLNAPNAEPTSLAYIYAGRVKKLNGYPEQAPVSLQVLRIGDLCIGTMPCEVFTEIGLEFKKRCPIQPSFLMSLSHGYLGYLPPPHQLDLGGYETWPGTNILEREASNKFLAELLEMVKEVQPASSESK